jgi:hypothetical protein
VFGIGPQFGYTNIHDTGEFVGNLVTLTLADGMHKTAFEHPPEIDEFEAAGQEKAPSVVVRPPRVALAPVAMECKLDREFAVGDYHGHVVWGCESASDLTPDRLPTVTLVGHTINSSIQCFAMRGLGSDLDADRSPGPTPNNIQLAHAGRKASTEVPWKGGM